MMDKQFCKLNENKPKNRKNKRQRLYIIQKF